uniref:Transmembrane protein n=1 Tax=Lotus japonicus TaxID=34305 RepID=I3T666_LOTJA|nr:unknown [Lotus japonicus]
MEVQQWWRLRFSFRSATMVVCFLNIVTAIFMLHGFLASSYTRNKLSTANSNSAQLSYIKESEEIRLAMLPLELIKRVREIEQEVYSEPEAAQKKDAKKTAAVDLSKRLKDLRALNDAAGVKALEEWRKRKMERARQRQLEKNGTTSSQT